MANPGEQKDKADEAKRRVLKIVEEQEHGTVEVIYKFQNKIVVAVDIYRVGEKII